MLTVICPRPWRSWLWRRWCLASWLWNFVVALKIADKWMANWATWLAKCSQSLMCSHWLELYLGCLAQNQVKEFLKVGLWEQGLELSGLPESEPTLVRAEQSLVCTHLTIHSTGSRGLGPKSLMMISTDVWNWQWAPGYGKEVVVIVELCCLL